MVQCKQCFLTFILILLITLPAFGEQNKFISDISYSAGAGLSYLNGQFREIVYTNADSANPYLSELLWNLDNIFLLNITAGASNCPWSLDISLGTAVTKGSGIMEDYDWGDYTITDWTNWSESLIFIDNSIFLDISSSYRYALNKFFSFPVKIGYKLNYLDWEDQLGEYIYKWDLENGIPIDPWVTGDAGGINAIDYKVIQNIFYAS
ncbi:MAG: omptin family outer membrane protease, partial [Spirochaetales bacterium]|nr:omptin family outer membrane protease [Spirochaetales bacterium]